MPQGNYFLPYLEEHKFVLNEEKSENFRYTLRFRDNGNTGKIRIKGKNLLHRVVIDYLGVRIDLRFNIRDDVTCRVGKEYALFNAMYS